MTALLRRDDPLPDAPDAAQDPMIATLRLAALACRAAPRASIAACGTIDPDADAGEYADLLVRMLPQMLSRRPVFRRPGQAERSFDEDWLVALAGAIHARDRASITFLMRRRVRPAAIPALRLMLEGFLERF